MAVAPWDWAYEVFVVLKAVKIKALARPCP